MDTVMRPVQNGRGRRRQWSGEQKLTVLQEWQTGVPLEEICRKYAVNAAKMYRWKRSLDQGLKEAEHWFHLAAAQGEATAQVNLGLLYANGYGISKDYVQAYYWYSRAGAQGHKEALELRSAVASKMNPVQIADAEQLADKSGMTN
jgi:TPR repeat protein